ncbi:MAG: hypothetical protein ACOYT4_02555 [Nanoarchaeota archaeon]
MLTGERENGRKDFKKYLCYTGDSKSVKDKHDYKPLAQQELFNMSKILSQYSENVMAIVLGKKEISQLNIKQSELNQFKQYFEKRDMQRSEIQALKIYKTIRNLGANQDLSSRFAIEYLVNSMGYNNGDKKIVKDITYKELLINFAKFEGIIPLD